MMRRKPRLLDLFCGAGGAGAGYASAGFEVVGIDRAPQPRYPFDFVESDVFEALPQMVADFDVIHASPPCQAHSAMRTMHNAKPHSDLIARVRQALQASGRLWVIENVVGAPLIDPILLCGTMFRLGCLGAELRRHRLFEANFPIRRLDCAHGAEPSTIGVYGGHVRNRKRREGSHARGVADFTPGQGRAAMEIDWMTLAELSEAIPPAFTEYVGFYARLALLNRGGENG